MSRVSRALARATGQLSYTSDTPRLDAELLMAAALGISRDKLVLEPPSLAIPARFSEMIARRLALEPVAYITGHRAFWTIDLEVGPGVLIPRPDSETLLVAAVEHFAGTAGPSRILDLGVGPGTLLLAALDEWSKAEGIGVDSSPIALSYAQRNAERLGLGSRATFQLGDWARALRGRFDLILCNPPYVPIDGETGPGVAEFEPAEALFAGADGLDDYRRLAPIIGGLLERRGLAAIEIGHDQGERAAALFAAAGHELTLARDLANRPRAVLIEG